MATITKLVPSGSVDGQGVKIVATATPGTLFHTAHATALDEIWMWLTNTDTVERQVTIEFGGATAPDQHVVILVPPKDVVLVLAGLVLTNSKTVRAFAAAANLVNMVGYVNRIS